MEAGTSGSDSELDSECVRRLDDGVEWISRLPDDIIVYILSFLPLKDAVATSLVSRRWSHLWRYTPNLIFKNDPFLDPMINIPVTIPKHKERDRFLLRSLKNIEWVNSVLNSHKALSIRQFVIAFYLNDLRFLTKWLHFALSRRVERLKLYFCSATTILDCKILSRLPRSDFKFLRELKLKNLDVSGEAVEFFICNCSLLERLILNGAMLTSDLMVCSTTLKYLNISRQYRGILTKVSAPNLIRLDSSYDLGGLFLENVPNLVEASFYRSEVDTTDRIAKAAANLEILTLTLIRPMEFSFPQMSRLRKLVVDYSIVNEEFLVPVTCLLEASPCLQEFRLKITDDKMHYHYSFPIKGSIFEVPKLGRQHHHLKVFEFSGFYGNADDHMELLWYIVDGCIALDEIIIRPIHPTVIPLSWPSIYIGDVVALESDEDDDLRIKRWTEQLLAGKLPLRIKLSVLDMEETLTYIYSTEHLDIF